jgi:hypothetical protein
MNRSSTSLAPSLSSWSSLGSSDFGKVGDWFGSDRRRRADLFGALLELPQKVGSEGIADRGIAAFQRAAMPPPVGPDRVKS